MLHLKTHTFNFSHNDSPRQLQFNPVASDDDELIRAIEDPVNDVWQLEAAPDTRELNQFWSGVEDDLKHDPTWFNFAGEDE